MTADKLHELHTARPFQRFIIHLADGREIPVPHPECMAHLANSRTAYVQDANGRGNHIDVMLITDLELGRNGKMKHSGRHAARRQ
ncbi:MAG: hypothetical protein NTW87_06605 [Planctomycetota bacterium]|nr:hypothetical protein [Planctomycetota bacterium]